MLDSMIEIARHLSHTIPYMRVDLYYISEQNIPKISVGELTFTSNGGGARFSPEHWDREFGKLWNLPHIDTRVNSHNPMSKI